MTRRIFSSLLLIASLQAGFSQTQQVTSAAATPTNVPHHRVPPRLERFTGTLLKVEGTNLVISVRPMRNSSREVTVGTDAQTEFRVNGQPGKLSDLKPTMLVQATKSPSPLLGPKLRVVAKDADLEATVIKASTTNILIKVVRPGPPREVALGIDSNTRIMLARVDGDGNAISPTLANVDNLKPDTRVTVGTANGIAVRITVAPPVAPDPATASEPATNK